MRTRFNAERAAKVVEFFSKRLHLTKGRWAGVRFILPDWQEEIVTELFGRERFSEALDRWIRLYRRAWIEVPKKNGKSPFGAGLALQGLLADGEQAPEVYGIASGKRQAGIVFSSAGRMVELEPALSKRAEVFKSKLAHHGVIHVPRSDGYYRVIPGDAAADDGVSPSRVIVDEVHRIRNREILDLMEDSLGGRDEPLVIYLTTSGVKDATTPAFELHEHAAAVADGRVQDPHLYVKIYGATEEEVDGDGWRDEDLWRRVNPAIGSFNPAMIEDLRASAIAAEISPVKIAAFKRLRLDVWLPESVTSQNQLLEVVAWDRSAGMVDKAKLAGRDVYAGLDMASSEDLAALVGVFPNLGGCNNRDCDADLCYDVIAEFWTPAAVLEGDSTTIPNYLLPALRGWVADGWLTVVDGEVIDDRDIKAKIDGWRTRYELVELAKDPYQSKQLGIELEEEGLTVYDHGQSIERMADPTDDFINAVRSKRFHHGGNPVLRWMVGNAVAKLDTNGLKRPDKKGSSGKIDGVVAAIIALAAAQRGDELVDVFAFTVGGS